MQGRDQKLQCVETRYLKAPYSVVILCPYLNGEKVEPLHLLPAEQGHQVAADVSHHPPADLQADEMTWDEMAIKSFMGREAVRRCPSHVVSHCRSDGSVCSHVCCHSTVESTLAFTTPLFPLPPCRQPARSTHTKRLHDGQWHIHMQVKPCPLDLED